ncbi:CHASE2 domain-containing protein [Chloroflexota bacterium]
MVTPQAQDKKRSRRETKRIYHTLVLAGVGIVFILITTLVQPFAGTNLALTDQLFTTVSPSPNIVIVGIDDNTLDTYGRLADWPRSLHAQAITKLSEAEAEVIGFDVLFVDSSPDDKLVADAISKAGNVVLPVVGIEPLPAEPMVTYGQVLRPVNTLEQAANTVGHVNITPDPDGTVRRSPLVVQENNGELYPSLGLSTLHVLFAMPLANSYEIRDGALQLLARDIPVDPSSRLRLSFSGDNGSRPYLSYGSVIRGDFDPSVVKNKIVLIGMTAAGEIDTWAIPTSTGKVPGVFIHAAAMETILKEWFLVEAGLGILALALALAVGITAYALPRLKLRWGATLIGSLFAGYLIASFITFDNGFILNMLYPLVILPVLYISNVFTVIVNEQSDKRFVNDLFGRYVSPQVAKEILSLADINQLNLGGEQREVTVLFADIRGFTQISERISPHAVVNMLNTYLAVISDKVLENGGMVNKFIGDNIMAIWNAPNYESDHAQRAVKSAWEAQQTIAELLQTDPTLPKAQFGIGINTGAALAGNVGSSGRSEYTVIGDAVNLASRICDVTPGAEIWIGPDTYQQTKDYLEAEELQPRTFKGKSKPIVVYRVKEWHNIR